MRKVFPILLSERLRRYYVLLIIACAICLSVYGDICLCTEIFVCVRRYLSVYGDICLCTEISVCVRRYLSVYGDICLCMEIFVCVQRYLSVYGDICLCTEIFVCVRRYLSVYGDICLCTEIGYFYITMLYHNYSSVWSNQGKLNSSVISSLVINHHILTRLTDVYGRVNVIIIVSRE